MAVGSEEARRTKHLVDDPKVAMSTMKDDAKRPLPISVAQKVDFAEASIVHGVSESLQCFKS